MATSSGSVVAAFDLSSSATTNGYFDSASPDRSVVTVNGGGGSDIGGCGDSSDSLICDNNNNEVTKLNGPKSPATTTTPPPCPDDLDDQDRDHHALLEAQILQHLTMSSVASAALSAKDQSIDSGVAGGDSDEADCGAPMSSVIQPPARPSSSGGVSSCSIIGEDEELLAPSPGCGENDFFMNGHDADHEPEEENNDLDGALEGPSLQRGKGFDQDCKICQNKLQSPRVLSCLHVFCESCLDAQLLGDVGLCMDAAALVCPVCQQRTTVRRGCGASSLHMDYVLTNVLDLSSIDLSSLACTSCKGKEVAISRCNDCANILCASCDNAHQYMRCFEKHTVVRLQDLLASSEQVAIHKPLFCAVHATENLKYYCQHCQVPVCNECLIGDHKGGEHSYEVIADAEQSAREELERLAKDSRAKVDQCNEAQTGLDGALTELQSQHDTARALIEESYQSFKAVLERCRDNALKQLDTLHAERELKVMEVMHEVEKCTEKIENANKFTDRVLSACNGPELLSLRALIGRQFGHLAEHIPRTSVSYSVEFDSDFDQFQRVAQDLFGRFRTETSAPTPKESTPPPTLPGLPPILINQAQQAHHQGFSAQRSLLGNGPSQSQQAAGQNSLMGISAFNGTNATLGGGSSGALTNSVTASSPISLPPSMQSSFDGDISALAQTPSSASTTGSVPSFGGLLDHHHSTQVGVSSGAVVVPPMNVPPPSLVGGPVGGLSSIAEYNIQQLANLVEQSSVVGTAVASVTAPIGSGTDMTDSILPAVGNVNVPPPSAPQGAITLNDILSIDPHALQAWSKMGGLNQQAANALLSRGPSPSVDNLLLNDFSAIAPNTDDLMLTNFNANAAGAVGLVSGQSQGGIGVPGRTKSTAMQIRCKFGSLGPSKGQFNSPHGFCLGVDEEIVVADTNNHRIEVFEKTGTFKFQFGVPGKDEGQLWYPRKVAVMRPSSKFVVCDRGNERSRMQIFNKAGHFMKKIAIRYIDIVAGLAVTNQGHIVAVDSVSPTVFIISEEGDLVHWFDCSDYMREPSDIAINGNDFYVCDFKGHCVAVFSDDGTFKYRIGNEKTTCFPNGIDISDAGDILIGDSHGNRFHVACFSRDAVLQSEYECPYVKVSRCCGLKITSEGFVVTLAKNNHHVLVLNTLYIQ